MPASLPSSNISDLVFSYAPSVLMMLLGSTTVHPAVTDVKDSSGEVCGPNDLTNAGSPITVSSTRIPGTSADSADLRNV